MRGVKGQIDNGPTWLFFSGKKGIVKSGANGWADYVTEMVGEVHLSKFFVTL